MTAATWTPERRKRHVRHVTTRRSALIEDVEWLLSFGTSPCVIAHRLGYQRPESLERHLYRIGRKDLAEQIRPAVPRRPR